MQLGTVLERSSGTIFNDLEWPLTQISKLWYFKRKMTRWRYKIELYLQRQINSKSYCDLSNGAISSDIE